MRFDFFKNEFCEREVGSEKIAIIGSDKNLNWFEFEESVNMLIKALVDLKVPKNCPVIIYGHKEANYPVAMLACIILKIPYIPLDTIYPIGRLENIKEQSGSEVIINFTSNRFKDFGVVIEGNFKVLRRKGLLKVNSKFEINKDNPLSYIIFTSGTTGNPKGVMIHRKSLNSFVKWVMEDHGFTTKDVFLSQSLFSFDVSLYGLFGALSLGSTVYLLDRDVAQNSMCLFDKIRSYCCSVWISTPSFVYMFLREKGFCENEIPSLKKYLFAGESLPPKTVQHLIERFTSSTILNAYGPTEATVTTTLVEITGDMAKRYSKLPIGYVKSGAEVLIENDLEENDNSGELIIVGDHVSSGYLNEEKLTKEKFFEINGRSAFRTGDLGYFENELLFCTGRNDHQVKLNGFRIELDDISKNIEEINGVSRVITIPLKRNGEVKRIASFLLIDSTFESKNNCQVYVQGVLRNKLPDYMVPGLVKIIDEIPLNVSGKVDEGELLNFL